MLGRQARWVLLACACGASGAQAQDLRLTDGRAAVAAGVVIVGAPPDAGALAPADAGPAVLDRHGRARAQLHDQD